MWELPCVDECWCSILRFTGSKDDQLDRCARKVCSSPLMMMERMCPIKENVDCKLGLYYLPFPDGD